MTDKELADRLVEIGILRDCNNFADGYYGLPGEAAMNPFKGSNLWRVAGAVMERCFKIKGGTFHISPYEGSLDGSYITYEVRLDTGAFARRTLGLSKPGESLPRAIIEAGLEALSDD